MHAQQTYMSITWVVHADRIIDNCQYTHMKSLSSCCALTGLGLTPVKLMALAFDALSSWKLLVMMIRAMKVMTDMAKIRPRSSASAWSVARIQGKH